MKIYRSEVTQIPQCYSGRRFAEEYVEKLKEQGAFRERKDSSKFISIYAEYSFVISEVEDGRD